MSDETRKLFRKVYGAENVIVAGLKEATAAARCEHPNRQVFPPMVNEVTPFKRYFCPDCFCTFHVPVGPKP